jgi:hypothetical protein
VYINPVTGRALYDLDSFAKAGILLKFLSTRDVSYNQPLASDFVPNLSVIDILMFNDDFGALLSEFDLT